MRAVHAEASVVWARSNRYVEIAEDKWTKAFDLRVLADGTRRLATQPGAGELVVVDQVPPEDWKAIQRRLARGLGSGEHQLGSKRAYYPDRSLTVRIDGASLRFVEEREFNAGPLDDEARARRVRALRAWAIALDALACAECTDQRDDDRRWIESR